MFEEGRGGQALMADEAHRRLVALLREGRLAAGQFVSMPVLVEALGMPLAATREAVKRAEGAELLAVLPKRGVMVMRADPATTRHCLDLRAILDQEGARRLIVADVPLSLDALRASHGGILAEARRALTPDLPARAIAVDLSLHDALATGLANPLAAAAYAANRDRLAVIQNTRPFLVDRITSAMVEHLAIIDALARRDAEAAVAAIRHHFHTTLRWWGIPA